MTEVPRDYSVRLNLTVQSKSNRRSRCYSAND